MYVCGRGVARLAGVDNDHGSALAPELECCGESGGRSADDPTSQYRSTVTGAWSLMTAMVQSYP